ncbi:conserved Plasmodium protein, unknown function [Plasmodium vinckei vinckei]|uniref:Uncharacterized protein n=1 Tax=Plasmodium vinckei vinckei TaxID=54757 RepID=A0A449BZX4_PLAVN|nr:conserved Plasmodium protein, unknown function [Plasmodium vinckei vinckei]KEG04331.1 hypothetical protein YYE_01237 [Plasmodium vinckei vinckei]VEV58869.1 conserved Plasmodium protein, unknown function [Plasmodium vinckei vinckei]
MDNLKKVLWSIEEIVYTNNQDEDIYEKKEKEIKEYLLNLYKNSFGNETEKLEDNGKWQSENATILEELVVENGNFFNLLKLVKECKYEKCITNPWVSSIFKLILEKFKNENCSTIYEIKREIFNFISSEKEQEKNRVEKADGLKKEADNASIFSCFVFYYEMKILLCCNIFLNMFVQCNWTGPSLINNNEKIKNNEKSEEDKYFNEFVDSIKIKNDDFLNSCLEFLSLEGEYIYEYCNLINSFCLCIIFLGFLNNFSKHDDEKNAHGNEYTNLMAYLRNNEDKNNDRKNSLDSLIFARSKYLWKARIYFIWQRLFSSSSSSFMYILKRHVIDTPFNIFKNMSILPNNFDLIERDFDLSEAVDIFSCITENADDNKKYCDLFCENYISEKFKIYILSNYSVYLSFYNYTYAYDKLLEILSESSKFYYTFTGRMGIKRKYQKNLATILVLKVKLGDEEDNTSTVFKEIEPLSEYDILRSDYKIIDNKNVDKEEKKTDFIKQITVQTKDEAFEKREDKNCVALGNDILNGVCNNVDEKQLNACDENNCVKNNTNDEETNNGLSENSAMESNGKKTWKLKDFDPDTDILEEPYFFDSQNNYFKVLSFDEQISLINYCFSIMRFNPHYDEIKFEKLNAIISRCLKSYDVNVENPKNGNIENEENGKRVGNHLLQIKYQNYLLHSCILWFKCKCESFRLKTVDRSQAQLNELLKEYCNDEPQNKERLKFIYDIYYPTTWEMKKEVGNIMIKTGSVVSAFNIFKDLKLWEEAIQCLIEADRKAEAKELLDTLLEKKKSPSLVCLYGLVNRESSLKYFIKAWDLSNYKYSKAARLIGKHYYSKEMYSECCDYLEKALEISPLLPDIWFILGCAYMKIDKFDQAIKAFTRMISMTNENTAMAYGNLAYLYMKNNVYKAAKICINQAVKINNNEWKYWDTYLKLSIVQNDVDSFCLALTTLCQLNQVKQIQPWVFDYISDLIVKDKPTIIPNKTGLTYLNKIIKTMNIISVHISEYDSFWNAYSFFLFVKGEFEDSFEAKIKEIRSIESMIQKCNVINKIEVLVSKQVNAIKFIYHLMKTHYTEDNKKGTVIYQLKNIIESTLRKEKYMNHKDISELSEIMEVLK